MFARLRLSAFYPSGDWRVDGPRLHKWLQDYWLSLEKPGALHLSEFTLDTSSTTPTVTSGSGTFTTVSSAVEGQVVGNRFEFTVTVTITTNGTAATDVRLTMPYNAAETTAISGRRTGPAALLATVDTSGVLNITNTDGTYPGADGRTLRLSGSYRKA